MNFLRKIGAWIWLNKERMVLAVMVCILCFRVYQVLNPKQEKDAKTFVPPRSEVELDVPVPPLPPRDPETQNWSRLWRQPIFVWQQPRLGARAGGQEAAGADIDVTLEQIRDAGDGTLRARIKTASRSGWYAEGQQFEQYTLLTIDKDKGCVTIFAEQKSTNVEKCIGSAQ